jgi:hypothetical protein
LGKHHRKVISKLTDFDPFENAPVDAAEEPFEQPASKKAPARKAAATSTSEGKLTLTLKGGAGFDSPWIVIHAADVDDALDQVSGDNASKLAKLMDETRKAANHFAGSAPAKAAAAGRPAPQAAGEAPAGTPEAPGPDWVYKTGVGKTGKTWKAWMPPRGSSESPVWL